MITRGFVDAWDWRVSDAGIAGASFTHRIHQKRAQGKWSAIRALFALTHRHRKCATNEIVKVILFTSKDFGDSFVLASHA